jgi:ABC-2 type transport system ATP-binding protein
LAGERLRRLRDRSKTVAAIEVENLHKAYGEVRAVDDISFRVENGEIFGFLGPNGAGKTSTIEIIEGYRKPDDGRATVLGLDPFRQPYEMKERVGIMLQSTSLYPDLRVGEIIKLFAGYYKHTVDTDALLEMMGLIEKKGSFVRELSGGQRQRLALTLAFINDPEILFLDEPTAGLDPQSRQVVWEWIEEARARGKTVFMTTHYIEEAEELCDRVAIIDHGRLIALDTPRRLMADVDADHRIEFIVDGSLDLAQLWGITGVWAAANGKKGEYTLHVSDPQRALKGLISLAAEEGFHPRDLRVEGATLEDAFIKLTGRRIRE